MLNTHREKSQPRQEYSPAQAAPRFSWLAPIAVGAITIVALGLRLYHIQSQSLTGDEAFSMLTSLRWLAGEMNLYGPESIEPTPPLYYLLLFGWVQLSGTSELAGRFLSVVPGTLLVPLAFTLGRSLGRRAVGVACALLFALNPFLIAYSQIIRSYILVTLLSALSSLALLWLFDKNRRRGRRRATSAYLLTTIIALYTHTFAVFLLGFHSLFWLVAGRGTLGLRRWTTLQAVIIIAFLPWIVRTIGLSTDPKGMWLEAGGPVESLRRVALAYSFGTGLSLGAQPLFEMAVLIGLIGLFCLGAISGYLVKVEVERARRASLFVLSYLLAPLFLAVLYSLNTPFLRDRYLLPFLPPLLIGVALGVALPLRLAGDRKHNLAKVMAGSLTLALLGLTVVPALTTLPRYYSQTIFASVNQAREFSSYLQATASPGALVIVNLPPSDPYFQYYDPGIETLFISDATPEGREADEKRLDQSLTDHREIWLVPFRYGSPEYHYVERDLSQRAFKSDERWFGNIQLVRYIRPTDQASLRHDLPFEFDQPFGKIQLLGYSLSPEEPRPGQNITLRLFWGASGPTRSPLKVFVHLDDSTGKTVAQSDAQPSTGSRPTTGWGSGEEIADNHALGLSAELPAGEYALVVGMYDESSGERLILADGQNSAKIATVSIR